MKSAITPPSPYISLKSLREIARQIEITDQLIRETGYSGMIHFRAPYGLKLPALSLVLHQMQRGPVYRTFCLFDWRCQTPEKMFWRFRRNIKPGAIVLLHDGFTIAPTNRDNTVKLVEPKFFIRKICPAGRQAVTNIR